MDFLVYVIGQNAVGAFVLAVVVLAVTHVWRHPRLAYWLWLLVLLKLVIPPVGLVDVPILGESRRDGSGGSGRDRAAYEQASAPLAITEEVEFDSEASHPPEGAPPANVPPFAAPRVHDVMNSAASRTNEAHGRRSVEEHGSNVEECRAGAHSAAGLVFFAWMCGSVIWLSVITYRTVRLRFLLRGLLPASESLKNTAEQVAGRLGLRSCPEVRIAEAAITPMVWCMGWRPLVVLPRQLMRDLQNSQVTAVLGHELAHIRQGDHWLRWLEVGVSVIYWWHPVAWLACRRLNEAQDLCCDSLTLETFPDLRGGYAQAVFATTEFLSTSQTPLPVMANGFGRTSSLKWRIEMILKDRFPYRLAWPVRMCLLCIALVGLPWSVQVVTGEVSVERDVAPSQPEDRDHDDPSARTPLPGPPNVPVRSQTRRGSENQSPRTSIGYSPRPEATATAMHALAQALRSDNQSVRLSAIRALGNHAVQHDVVQVPLAEAIKDSDTEIAEAALEALANCGSSEKAVDVVVHALKDEDGQIRIRAVAALDRMEIVSDEVTTALVTALGEDENVVVRRNAAHLLGKVGKRSTQAVDALSKAITDAERSVGEAAVEALANIVKDYRAPISPINGERTPQQASGPRNLHFVTPHFKGTVHGVDNFVEVLAARAEELRKELAVSWIGHTLPQKQATCKITVSVGDNLASGGATSFSFSGGKPSDFQMRLQGPRDRILNDHLPHEIMHIILAEHFNRPIDRWAAEGICQMVESAASREIADKQLKTLDRDGRLYSLTELFSMGPDYPSDVLPIHCQGYSLIKFLVEQNGGKQKVIEFIGTAMADGVEEAIREHYGFGSIGAFEKAWRAATLPTD